MLIGCKANYSAGGVVMPIYQGHVSTTFNIEDDADEDRIQEVAGIRLKQKVSKDSLIHTSMVKLEDLRVAVLSEEDS